MTFYVIYVCSFILKLHSVQCLDIDASWGKKISTLEEGENKNPSSGLKRNHTASLCLGRFMGKDVGPGLGYAQGKDKL